MSSCGHDKLDHSEWVPPQAFPQHERAFGANATSTLQTMANLGTLYHHQCKLDEALQMYARALAGFEKTLGIEPSTLNIVNNLGILYRDRGKPEEAKKMYMRALRGYEKVLGSDHPSTLGTVNNLGILCRDEGKLEEAEQKFERVRGGYEKRPKRFSTEVFGPSGVSRSVRFPWIPNLYVVIN